MFEQIAQVVARYEEIERQMTDPAVMSDHKKLTELAQERSDIEPLFKTHAEYQRTQSEINDAKEMIQMEDDKEMISMFQEELKSLEATIPDLEQTMRHQSAQYLDLQVKCSCNQYWLNVQFHKWLANFVKLVGFYWFV